MPEKCAKYFEAFKTRIEDEFSARSSVHFTEEPIFVTCEERESYNDINNQTIEQIIKKIEAEIASISDPQIKEDFEHE